MSISVLALRRAKKQLDVFCEKRSRQGASLTCLSESDRQVENDALVLKQNEQALVRLQFDGAQWRIFWHRDTGQWEPWPHLPVCDDIQEVIEQLEQAPLHVHWAV